MGYFMIQKGFRFYVGKSAGMHLEMTAPAQMHLEAGFNNDIHAKAFAAIIADGLNFVLIYNEEGKTLWTFSPDVKLL